MRYYSALLIDFQTRWRYIMPDTGSKNTGFPIIKCLLTALVCALVCFLLVPQPVHAYIDPGTGGLIIQSLIGLLAGALAMLGIFWKRVTMAVKNMFKRKNDSPEGVEGAEASGKGSGGDNLSK